MVRKAPNIRVSPSRINDLLRDLACFMVASIRNKNQTKIFLGRPQLLNVLKVQIRQQTVFIHGNRVPEPVIQRITNQRMANGNLQQTGHMNP